MFNDINLFAKFNGNVGYLKDPTFSRDATVAVSLASCAVPTSPVISAETRGVICCAAEKIGSVDGASFPLLCSTKTKQLNYSSSVE